jgi:proteic killer suppression protein
VSEILSNRFVNRDTELAFHGQYVRWLPPDIRRRAKESLRRVALAPSLENLRFPPSQRLEALRGDREGQHSIRINDQWRVCFTWTEMGAIEIEITDYH